MSERVYNRIQDGMFAMAIVTGLALSVGLIVGVVG